MRAKGGLSIKLVAVDEFNPIIVSTYGQARKAAPVFWHEEIKFFGRNYQLYNVLINAHLFFINPLDTMNSTERLISTDLPNIPNAFIFLHLTIKKKYDTVRRQSGWLTKFHYIPFNNNNFLHSLFSLLNSPPNL